MLLFLFIAAISSCYPQQGVASNDNLGGSNNINNLYMRQQPARGHHYYNHQPHYYYPGEYFTILTELDKKKFGRLQNVTAIE